MWGADDPYVILIALPKACNFLLAASITVFNVV
jgi:hypothetical protein